MRQLLGMGGEGDLWTNKDIIFVFPDVFFFFTFWPNDWENIFQNTLEDTNLLIVLGKSICRKLCGWFETGYTTTLLKICY